MEGKHNSRGSFIAVGGFVVVVVVVILLIYTGVVPIDGFTAAQPPTEFHQSHDASHTHPLLATMVGKEYSLDSVDLGGKTLGYIRVSPRPYDVIIHVRVPGRRDYDFIMNVIDATAPEIIDSNDIDDGSARKSIYDAPDFTTVNADIEADSHIEKEAFAGAESSDSEPFTVGTHRKGGGFYPHAARYSMSNVGYRTMSSIPSAMHQELPDANVSVDGPAVLLSGYDYKGGEGTMLITLEKDKKIHLRSNILAKILLDIERKKMPHYHYTLTSLR